MDQWLVRTANNILAGPYSRDQVVRLIQDGKLGLQDEVCQANHYWIFLHEHVEVERQLGIHVPRAAQGDDEEITETQTDAVDEVGEPPVIEVDLAPMPEAPLDYDGSTAVFSHGSIREAQSSKGAAPPASTTHPGTSPQTGSTMSHLAGVAPSAPAQAARHPGVAYPTSTMNTPNMGMTAARTQANANNPRPAAPPSATNATTVSDIQIERTSIWKSFAWLMIFLVCLIVFAVLRLLRSSHV